MDPERGVMRIRYSGRIALFGIKIVDLLQSGILANYRLFSLIVGHAPQKYGATACWIRAGKEFLLARARVPAYRKFLKDQNWSCRSADIKEIFASLPVMDKKNYILVYTTEERCLDGKFFEEG